MFTYKSVFNARTYSQWFSDQNLTKKASLNAFTSALDYGARLLVGFIINPILVNGLGVFGYGVWQVLGNIIETATALPT